MGISQRIRNIFSQNQESTLTIENQQTSFNGFDKTVKRKVEKILKHQIPDGDWSSKENAIIRLNKQKNCNQLQRQWTK